MNNFLQVAATTEKMAAIEEATRILSYSALARLRLRLFLCLSFPAQHFLYSSKKIMDRNNDEGRIPDNDSSKAMDSKKEVDQSNDEKTDQDFPGYPHYPAKEDIMDQRTDSHRVDMDVENLPSNRNATGVSQRFAKTGRQNAQEPLQPGLGRDELLRMGS
ncbi:MAG TPA: hypothetical protein VNR87_13575, partial [Flavisolibacter sp.]|nr:hypothetical protein [Flavisolibacter sp.]